MKIMLIAGFGALGALSRFGLASLVGQRSFPYATLVTNVLGSFALGVVLTVATQRLRPELAAGLAVGFLGAFTTFSTLSWDTFTMFRNGRPVLAMANVIISVVLGVGAAGLGYLTADRVLGLSAASQTVHELDERHIERALELRPVEGTQEHPGPSDMTD